ncbi:MAG: hypothetical protein SOZ08_01840 [Erysipelotrichaceae bacterium]|nr:hypothetical protein [Erysipelotrichaceae bacterium]
MPEKTDTKPQPAEPVIDFKTVLMELSDRSIADFRKRFNSFADYIFIDPANADKQVLLEKLGVFLAGIEKRNHLHDTQLASTYTKSALSYLAERVQPGSSTDDYLERITEISIDIKVCKSEDVISMLEDFTKGFLCLYSTYLQNNQEPVRSVDFRINQILFYTCMKSILKDEKQKKGNSFINGVKKKADAIVPEVVKDAAADMLHDGKELAYQVNMVINQFNTSEPVYNVLVNQSMDNTRYTIRNFTYVMALMFYLRMRDFEVGENE